MKPLLLTLALALTLPVLHAQQTTSPQYVFHAYSNLIQIPVLALSEYQQPIPPDTTLSFAVSIDGGTPFPAKHVRSEADDPISLAIVIDMSGDQQRIAPVLADEIADLAPDLLQPQDHVIVYAVDCKMARTANDIPIDKASLRRAVDDAVQSTLPHGDRNQTCPTALHLWDTLSYATNQLSTLPGRRVLLAITDGHDNASLRSWSALREFANDSGVAIFGLADAPYSRAPDAASGAPFGVMNKTPGVASADAYEDHFQMLTQLSGGLVLIANLPDLAPTLQNFARMLRARYIVEFPRPDSLTKGPHSFAVSVANSKTPYFLRPAGISLPIADPAILADPTTVPSSDPSQAPVLGDRKILRPTKQ